MEFFFSLENIREILPRILGYYDDLIGCLEEIHQFDDIPMRYFLKHLVFGPQSFQLLFIFSPT
jgi:hypothetical protein